MLQYLDLNNLGLQTYTYTRMIDYLHSFLCKILDHLQCTSTYHTQKIQLFKITNYRTTQIIVSQSLIRPTARNVLIMIMNVIHWYEI